MHYNSGGSILLSCYSERLGVDRQSGGPMVMQQEVGCSIGPAPRAPLTHQPQPVGEGFKPPTKGKKYLMLTSDLA